MMSLEMFNDHILPGKTVEELYALIEDFKIEQIFLKVQIEKENIADITLPPAEIVAKIASYRLYIGDTYKQIERLDGVIERADEEEFAIQFQENLSKIKEIDYQIGGYFGEDEEYKVVFEDESSANDGIDKVPFLKAFANLHVGEWREAYSATDYGQEVMDGTSWRLTIHFSGEMKPAEFIGSNAFPYNYGLLDQLLKKEFN